MLEWDLVSLCNSTSCIILRTFQNIIVIIARNFVALAYGHLMLHYCICFSKVLLSELQGYFRLFGNI